MWGDFLGLEVYGLGYGVSWMGFFVGRVSGLGLGRDLGLGGVFGGFVDLGFDSARSFIRSKLIKNNFPSSNFLLLF